MNLVYHTLTHNLNGAQKAQFDLELVPPKERERLRDRQNADALKQLAAMGPKEMPVPLPHKRRKLA